MTQNDLRDAFPVMRFDYNKRLIDSNLTALPLLGEWKCRKGLQVLKIWATSLKY